MEGVTRGGPLPLVTPLTRYSDSGFELLPKFDGNFLVQGKSKTNFLWKSDHFLRRYKLNCVKYSILQSCNVEESFKKFLDPESGSGGG